MLDILVSLAHTVNMAGHKNSKLVKLPQGQHASEIAQLCIKIPSELARRLGHACIDRNKNRSELVVEALEALLAKEGGR